MHRVRRPSGALPRAALLALRLAGLGALLACGGEDEPPPPPPTRAVLTVVDAGLGTPIAGARLVLRGPGGVREAIESDAEGRVQAELAAGRWTIEAAAAGYLSTRRFGLPPLGVELVAATDTATTVRLEPRVGAVPGGTIEGLVVGPDGPATDALVVAEGTARWSGHTDGAGRFRLLGVAPGLYRVSATVGGRSSTALTNVRVEVGGTASGSDLTLSAATGSRVSGTLGAGPGETTVFLARADTGDLVPGLAVRAGFGGAWAVEGVTAGRYRVWAALEDEGRVLDPELFRADRLPIVEVDGSAEAMVDLPTAPALRRIAPADGAELRGTPSFEWAALAEAEWYVVEVLTESGETVWGGFDARRRPVMRVLAPATSVAFGELATPARMLEPGRRYRWRVYAAVDTNDGNLFRLIGASEIVGASFRAR
jgi:hypothetical protein